MDPRLDFIHQQLENLARSNDSFEEQTKKYQTLLDNVLEVFQSSPGVLVDCLKAIIQAIFEERVSLEVSRPVLSCVRRKLKDLPEEVWKEISHFTLEKVQPRLNLFEEQVAGIIQQLTDFYEKNEQWKEAANVLVAIPLETEQMHYTNEQKMQTYLKLTEFYLACDDLTRAKEFIKKASLLQPKVKGESLKIRYKFYQAKVLDHEGDFVKAAAGYYKHSRQITEHKTEALQNAIICTVLSSAGKEKNQMLATLYKDEQCKKLPGYKILRKMHRRKIIEPTKLKDFENCLQPHQKALATNDLGFTVLKRAVIEHNLLLASYSRDTIEIEKLGSLLKVPPAKIETIVVQMISEKRLKGHIDREKSIVDFRKTKRKRTLVSAKSNVDRSSRNKSPTTRVGRLKSIMWNVFTLDKENRYFAICKICKERVKRGHRCSTSSMIAHFKQKHKKVNIRTYKDDNSTQTEPETSSKSKVKSIDKTRLKVRDTLAEALTTRKKETISLNLKVTEIAKLAVEIESELFKLTKNTGSKYKSKYHSLLSNIKDAKNMTFFRKILNKTLTPAAIVRLDANGMASQELTKMRENESKHELEKITKNELDLMALANSRTVIKTHKGERVIEKDSSGDYVHMETPVQNIDSKLDSERTTHKSKEDGGKRQKLQDEESRDGVKRRKTSCDDESSEPNGSEKYQIKDFDQSEKNSSGLKKNLETSTEVTEESTEEHSMEYDEESDAEISNEKVQQSIDNQANVWRAFLQMENKVKLSSFSIIGQEVNGKSCDLMEKLPNSIQIVGRSKCDEVWQYIENIKKHDATDVIVLKLTPVDDKDKTSYTTYYNELIRMNRLGAIKKFSVHINIYIMPFSGEVPPVLQSAIGGAVDKTWLKGLLAIVIPIKKPRTQSIVQETKQEASEAFSNKTEQKEELLDDSCKGPSNNESCSELKVPQEPWERHQANCSFKEEIKCKKRKSEELEEKSWSEASEAERPKEFYSRNKRRKVKDDKTTSEKISSILSEDRPYKLSLVERNREMNIREKRKLKIILTAPKVSLNPKKILSKLQSAIHRSMGFWVKFKHDRPRAKKNGEYILTVNTMEEKMKILKGSKIFKFYGGYLCNDHTDREKQLQRWLNKKERELSAIGVRAKAMYLGIFIDSFKWVWDETKWELVKTNIKFKPRR